MEAIVEKLSALLEDEVTLFRTMLTIVQAEKEAVIHADHIAVSQICRRKENLILKIKIIEAQRERLMERAGVQLGLATPDISLHALSQHVGQLEADRLRASGACVGWRIQISKRPEKSTNVMRGHVWQGIN